MSQSNFGGRSGLGGGRKPSAVRKTKFTVSLAPNTTQFLETVIRETGAPQGVIVDMALRALQSSQNGAGLLSAIKKTRR